MPWIVVGCGLVLLVLVGRGMAGAVLGRGPAGTSSAVDAVTQAASTGAGSTGRSGPSATAGATPSVETVPTVGPTPPQGLERVVLARASSNGTTATGRGGAAASPGSAGSNPPATRPAVAGSPIVGVQSGKCIDAAGGSSADLTRIDLSTCDGGAAQAISHTAAGELRVLGKCLDAMNQHTFSGTPIILYTCNGQLNQKWNLAPNGTITGVQSNLCLDATAQGTTDGTPLELWACNGGANQAWAR